MDFKNKAAQIKKELDGARVQVEEVSGIKIAINGSQDFQSIEIDESLLGRENKGKFEADLLRSMNAAIKKSQGLAAQKMSSVMPVL